MFAASLFSLAWICLGTGIPSRRARFQVSSLSKASL